jgi:hypothetical membrane protein
VFVARPAGVSAFLAPVLFLGGTAIAGLAWPAYHPVSQTISELAAGDAPTRVFMTIVFVLTALCHVVTGVFTRGVGLPGRVALVLAGVATLGVAVFPLPSVAGTSVQHRVAAIIGFVLLAIWPVLGMRLSRGVPWIIRPVGAILGTVVLGALCFWFLGVWTSPNATASGILGVVERVPADAESLWPALVVAVLLVAQRRGLRPDAASR